MYSVYCEMLLSSTENNQDFKIITIDVRERKKKRKKEEKKVEQK